MGHIIWDKEMGMNLEGVSWVGEYDQNALYELFKVLLKYF